MSDAKVEVTRHEMTRLDIHTAMPFSDFRMRFERAAPVFDEHVVQDLVERHAPWDDMRAAMEKMAPHELIRYVTIDATPVMSLAGNRTQAVEYLLGNHFIAESMFRHDPHALLYAPLRVLLYSDDHGDAIFSLDQPSTAFGSLGVAEISRVGFGLDDKVSALLTFLGVQVTIEPTVS